MSDILEEESIKPQRLERIPISIRLPIDIVKELPFIAVFNHKSSTSELMREWIVQEASSIMNKSAYTKYKQDIIEAHERTRQLSSNKRRL